MPRLFTAVSCIAFLATSCSKSPSALSVEELAKEGHWGTEPAHWQTHSQFLGKPAPTLELSDWVGKPVKPQDMKGKIVIVDFWGTWCTPCIAAIPEHNARARKYAGKGVLVVAACGGGGEEKMAEIAASKGMEYPTARVSEDSTKAWGVIWWPHYAIVDRNGNVRAIGIKPEYISRIVEALIKEQGDKPAGT